MYGSNDRRKNSPERERSAETSPAFSRHNSPRPRTTSLSHTYAKVITREHCPLLYELKDKWSKQKPLQDKKVLINCHLTTITLLFIDVIRSAGAEVEVTATDNLVVHENTLELLQNTVIPYHAFGEIPTDKCTRYYDFIFDCGAGTLALPDKVEPKFATAELTRTHRSLYDDIKHTVIDVDTSETKKVETYWGTGDAAVRALALLIKRYIGLLVLQTIDNITTKTENDSHKISGSPEGVQISPSTFINFFLQPFTDVSTWFKSQKIILFGYGKVGKGIIAALHKAGVPKAHMTIIDVSKDVIRDINNKSETRDYDAVWLSNTNKEGMRQIKEKLLSTSIVFTCTGIQGAISSYFQARDFSKVTHKINMGTNDEWGLLFAPNEIENNKKPANFLLSFPTAPMYLDPIFALMAQVITNYLDHNDRYQNVGYTPVDNALDACVLKKWQHIHEGKKWEHVSELKTISQFATLLQESQDKPATTIKGYLRNFKLLSDVPTHTHLICGEKIRLGQTDSPTKFLNL